MLEDIKEYNGFDQNWAKSGPLLYAILEIMNAMDRPMVQWFEDKSQPPTQGLLDITVL